MRNKSVNQGAKNPMAKLNEIKVKNIRKLARPPYLYNKNKLAKMYKISTITINQVLNYYSWTHV